MQSYDQLIQQASENSENGETLAAMNLFAAAAQAAPDRKEPLVELALLFSDEGDLEGAAGFLEKALNIDSRDAFIRLNLGLAYYAQQRLKDAVRQLRDAVLIIQHFQAGTRIDSMFVDSPEMTARLAQAEELEEVGAQAIELLKVIAGELAAENAA